MTAADDALDRHRSEADYIDRTIATVRNHREADNCWPQWANIFADEIEDLRADVQRLRGGISVRDALVTENAIRAAAAEAEVQRYREGLRRQQRLTALYAHRLGEHDPGCEWCVMAAEQEAAEARALLAGSAGEHAEGEGGET